MNNPLLNMIGNNMPNNNGFDMQGFINFAKSMKGKNPKQMVLNMLNTGQINNNQFNQMLNQAKEISKLFKK